MANISAFSGPQLLTQDEFLTQTGCPAEQFEEWLARDWSQHDIRRVLAGMEKIGRSRGC